MYNTHTVESWFLELFFFLLESSKLLEVAFAPLAEKLGDLPWTANLPTFNTIIYCPGEGGHGREQPEPSENQATNSLLISCSKNLDYNMYTVEAFWHDSL